MGGIVASGGEGPSGAALDGSGGAIMGGIVASGGEGPGGGELDGGGVVVGGLAVSGDDDKKTAAAGRYRFMLTPKWLASHVAVLCLVAAMLAAGFWQLDRLSDRVDRNRMISSRSDQASVMLEDAVGLDDALSVGESKRFTRVTVQGTFLAADEVLIRNRTYEGAPGFWVLTPLITEHGWAVAVNRGWIPASYKPTEARVGTEAPVGTVTVHGTIQPSVTAELFQASDPQAGRVASLARADLERLGRQVNYPLMPVVVRAEARPGAAGISGTAEPLPALLPLPPLDDGPHLGYAVQWFVFSAIAVGGYPLVLIRTVSGKD